MIELDMMYISNDAYCKCISFSLIKYGLRYPLFIDCKEGEIMHLVASVCLSTSDVKVKSQGQMFGA